MFLERDEMKIIDIQKCNVNVILVVICYLFSVKSDTNTMGPENALINSFCLASS